MAEEDFAPIFRMPLVMAAAFMGLTLAFFVYIRLANQPRLVLLAAVSLIVPIGVGFLTSSAWAIGASAFMALLGVLGLGDDESENTFTFAQVLVALGWAGLFGLGSGLWVVITTLTLPLWGPIALLIVVAGVVVFGVGVALVVLVALADGWARLRCEWPRFWSHTNQQSRSSNSHGDEDTPDPEN